MSKAIGLMPKQQALEFLARSPVQGERGLNTALFIASVAMHGQKSWDGKDYDLHYLTVALNNPGSHTKIIIGILHDVIEDTDWTLDDLRQAGFSQRVVDGVDGVTKRPGEKYFDFIRRCSTNPDSVDVKLQDLKDNMSVSRNPGFPDEKQLLKQRAYIASYQYLVAVKQREIAPGILMSAFLRLRPLINDPALLCQFSSEQSALKTKFVPGPGPK